MDDREVTEKRRNAFVINFIFISYCVCRIFFVCIASLYYKCSWQEFQIATFIADERKKQDKRKDLLYGYNVAFLLLFAEEENMRYTQVEDNGALNGWKRI